jgi:hypothetical protein
MAKAAPKISSGVSGPAYARAAPRVDPIQKTTTGGPSVHELQGAWGAYDGQFAGPLTPLAGQPDLNVVANRISSFVRTGVDFLFGPALKLQHPDNDAQKILDKVWGNEDQKMTFLAKLRVNGGVFGQCIVKIVTPTNKKDMSVDNPPRLVVQNPQLYEITTDPNDCDMVDCYACTWDSQDDDGNPCQKRQTTTRVDPDFTDNNVPDDADTHWEIQNWQRTGTGEAWLEDGPVILWPYVYPPLVDWQNYPNPNDHWGSRDVDDGVVNLNRNLHLVESNINSVLYSNGHPWVFSSGTDTSAITPTPGSITDLGSPDAKVFAVTANGDIAQMMAFAEMLREDMDEATSTPGVALARMTTLPRGALSGITVRLLYGARIARTEHERRLYGQGIRDICKRLLILCGQQAASEQDVMLTWQDPLPQDDLAMAQMALALQQLGLSDHTVYQLIGQNYDIEQQFKASEAQDKMAAVAKGQAMPQGLPMPPADQMMPASIPGAVPQPPQPPLRPGQPPSNGTPPVLVNHPAAVQARARMKAIAGK